MLQAKITLNDVLSSCDAPNFFLMWQKLRTVLVFTASILVTILDSYGAILRRFIAGFCFNLRRVCTGEAVTSVMNATALSSRLTKCVHSMVRKLGCIGVWGSCLAEDGLSAAVISSGAITV